MSSKGAFLTNLAPGTLTWARPPSRGLDGLVYFSWKRIPMEERSNSLSHSPVLLFRRRPDSSGAVRKVWRPSTISSMGMTAALVEATQRATRPTIFGLGLADVVQVVQPGPLSLTFSPRLGTWHTGA